MDIRRISEDFGAALSFKAFQACVHGGGVREFLVSHRVRSKGQDRVIFGGVATPELETKCRFRRIPEKNWS